ncbi:PREDICTED: serine-rich adhesin for platelets isoform X1 [Trachymyrmex cornetzi]|uniref:serine-rich adhesin for platelets isoform X1 n=1 Tax=Trachymyrmex cornetzi TaxID=471704 RepID=UPI00084EF58B|nr:PREDICTED: serine-rich adhesin for platelets isoform X1 [Trachymyrmex cornetzi]XP_018370223.1 PREDICTED: serine-rich adhesin for platelets isoform X1 [Trachymyrmex cornetzi]
MSDLLNTIVMETSYPESENCLKVASPMLNVARQDSGVPEDLVSPLNGEEDPDLTMNSECNITVIHISESQNVKTNDKSLAENKDSKDGSDSGVEGCATEVPRVRSRNSIDYTSSCGGLDDASCASSLVSCCSVYEDACGSTLPDDVRLGATGGEGTSEGGSESSSIAGSVSVRTSRMNVKRITTTSSATKKKITSGTESQKSARTKPTNTTSSTSLGSTTPRSKSRTATPRNILTKTQSTSRERDHRPRSREKLSARESNSSLVGDVSKTPVGSRSTVMYGCRSSSNVMSSSISTPTSSSIAKTRTRVLPDSLPSALTTEINKDLAQRSGRVIRNDSSRSRTASSTRGARTPVSTPSEETRVKVPSLSTSRALCAKSTVSRTDNKATGQDNKALDTYATLPRRNRNKLIISKIGEKTDKTARSRSGSRDVSLSRTIEKKNIMGRDSSSAHKSLPPYPRQRTVEKTRIYHETSAQTGLTGQDIENMMSGQPSAVAGPEVIERLHKDCQTEDAWNDVQTLQDNLRRLNEESSSLRKENERLKLELAEANRLLEEERADHAFARQELDRNAQRVLAMLGTPQSEHAEGSDSFLELECHIQSSGQVVANQQVEIADLQSLCRMLNRDLDKSLAAQKALLQQQQELEAESAEMQDFLQEEKATLADALKDAELELKKKGEALTQKETELERQTEECKHLVRISEQRRQENLSMSLKLNAVERRSRELLLTQGAAMSGAAVALSGLSTRLEGLVDQLIASYNISVKDLEDVIYHNEAYSRSNSSVESSPVSSKQSLKERTPSPKSGSFVSAVISAIRNAATHPFAARNNLDKKSSLDSSKQIYKELSMESSSDLLDFETEPCLMMESVLEDVPLPDTYSHNMVSSSDSLRRALSFSETSDEHNMRKTKYIDECTSLTNLTQAILHRRKVEDEGDDDCDSVSESDTGTNDGPMPLVDYCPSVDLVDQVIEVDNLVTKLLKVLRIIQLDNDTCIQELKEDKSNLEIKLEATVTELNELRKIIDNFHQSPEDVLNNVSDRRRSVGVMENCRILLKEVIAGDVADTF